MLQLDAATARRLLLRAAHLERPTFPAGLAAPAAVLSALRCIQLDPIDRVGANADLVVHARADGVRRGDWSRLGGTRSFEHYAKERCLLPADRFPRYRDQAAETPDWRLTARLKRVPAAALSAVRDEVLVEGPVSPADMGDHGRVRPIDWSGWTSTAKLATMALEVLAVRCALVVVGRSSAGQRVYDVPERALPEHWDQPGEAFLEAGVVDRVAAAGLLARASGPTWGLLGAARTGPVLKRLLADGRLLEARLPGSRRVYLVRPIDLEAASAPLDPDDRMRVLGPLDPLLWDRRLVQQAFGFAYVWEVYKPAAQRTWGYYVCPLLHEGRLVGRIEARRGAGGLEVLGLWGAPDRGALDAALHRLEAMQPRRTTPSGGP